MAGNRSIFEDVASNKNSTRSEIRGSAGRDDMGLIQIWLTLLFSMVVLIIIVGGLTRLTDSGLSITEWAPIKGSVPPLSAESWQNEFDKYQAIPEFQIQNSAMTLHDFKMIYWWEWGHRFLARMIGVVWAVGFAAFSLRKSIPRGWSLKLLLIGLLGGLQGAIGWWMVSSGLTGRMVDVASYRLAIHLGIAFVILGLIVWYSQALRRGDKELLQARRRREEGIPALANVAVALVFFQILLGALVAGLDAGRGYTDWPLMAGQLFPDSAFNLTPWLVNFTENMALTQFNHRLVGYLLLAWVVIAWIRSKRSAMRATKFLFRVSAILCLVQAIVGIVTVMNAAPLGLATLHQIGAIFLWTIVIMTRFETQFPRVQSVRS